MGQKTKLNSNPAHMVKWKCSTHEVKRRKTGCVFHRKSQTHWNECNFINYHFLSQIKIFIGFLQTQKISTVGLNWIMLTIGHCNSSIFLSHQFYPSRYSRTFSNKVVHRFSLAGVHINLSTVLGSLKRG